VREAWGQSIGGFTEDELYWLFEAVVLQRARVPRTADEFVTNTEKMALYAFREHLKGCEDNGYRDELIAAIDRGECTLDGLELESVLNAIEIATQSVIGILDLHIAILRNRTDYPFVFGDCPCVFYNKYLYSVQDRGVLGFCTPGLMIFLPLDLRTQLMLFDPAVYTVQADGLYVDIADLPNVSQLNALQLHMANDCVYFWRRDIEEYLVNLILAHRSKFDAPRSVLKLFRTGEILIDGAPSDGEVLHTFDYQLPHQLELSFLQTAVPPKGGRVPWARNKEIDDELKAMHRDSQKGTPIEAIVADVKANLRRR
jgi:hypothetical protein